MTSQTKHYIEVSDIVALRFDCKHCGAVLTLTLAKDMGNSINECPVCGKGWARLENSTSELLIKEFAQKCSRLVYDLPHLGFNLSLELSSDPASVAKD
jgi:hypothetical protein